MPTRILIADDHTLLLDGFRLILEPEFVVIGSVEDGQALIEAAQSLKPDVILLDISMPILNGIEAAAQLSVLVPAAKIIFVTMHTGVEYVSEAFRAGAAGYLLKRAAASELLTAIREVCKGRYYVSPLVTRETIEFLLASPKEEGRSADGLTTRQREILRLVAEGSSRKEIASILNISVKTVEFHKASLARQLEFKNAADFTKYAIKHGLIASK